MDNFSRGIGILRKNPVKMSEMQNTATQMKNAFNIDITQLMGKLLKSKIS